MKTGVPFSKNRTGNLFIKRKILLLNNMSEVPYRQIYSAARQHRQLGILKDSIPKFANEQTYCSTVPTN
jgi:hypothetical protein